MARSGVVLWFIVATMACSMSGSMARDHIVGSSTGWRIPKNTTFYQEWAQNRTFAVGDRLVFLFTTAVHSLMEVSAEDFRNCTQDNVINMIHNGPIVLEITKPGPHYYYCGIGTHCEAGMKLSINVSATAKPDDPMVAVATAPVASEVPPGQPDSKPSAGSSIHAFPLAGVLMYLLHVMVM